MEPTVSEQPQTEQPAPVEIPVQHQHSEQGKFRQKCLSLWNATKWK